MPVFPSDGRNVTIWIVFSCLSYIHGSNWMCGSMPYPRECRNSHIHGVLPTLQPHTNVFSQLRRSLSVGAPHSLGGLSGTELRLHWLQDKSGPKKCLWRAMQVLLAGPSKQGPFFVWRIMPNRERQSLMTRLILLLVTLIKHLLRSFCPLHFCPLLTPFSSILFKAPFFK